MAGGAVQCSDWSDVDSGRQISREVASKQHSQQKQHRQVLFLDEWRLRVESVLHLKHEVSPDSSSANSTFGLCRGLMGGGRFVFLYFIKQLSGM